MSTETCIDTIISKLLSINPDSHKRKVLIKSEIRFLCEKSTEIFKNEKSLLDIHGDFVVCGDIHGQFFDLLDILKFNGPPETTNYLFLGDYVDRGNYSIYTICILLAYKIKYKDTFFLIRGNHESSFVNRKYGFREECCELYSEHIWPLFNSVFEWMPIAALVNNDVLCIHGGISPLLTSLDDIMSIERPCEVPEKSLLTDLLWSDPQPNCDDWGINERRCGCTFGEKQLNETMEKLNVKLIIRAHEVVESGYDFPFNPNKSLVTLFSAPDYEEEANLGAYMKISMNNEIVFGNINPKRSLDN